MKRKNNIARKRCRNETYYCDTFIQNLHQNIWVVLSTHVADKKTDLLLSTTDKKKTWFTQQVEICYTSYPQEIFLFFQWLLNLKHSHTLPLCTITMANTHFTPICLIPSMVNM